MASRKTEMKSEAELNMVRILGEPVEQRNGDVFQASIVPTFYTRWGHQLFVCSQRLT